MKKVLIITYYWPPSGGAGVQRWLKFAKYLRDFGWEPVVYTPSNPENPVEDSSLLKDIPQDIEIIKTPIWEPYDLYKRFVGRKKDEKINTGFLSEKKKSGFTEKVSVWLRGNFFIPDARKFWIRPSVKFLTDYLAKNRIDVIVSTGPPHSMHLIAMELKTKLSIPWLADFRDPWTNIDYYNDLLLTSFADKRHHRLEREVLEHADAVVSIGGTMKEEFISIISNPKQEAKSFKFHVVTNGYDIDDVCNESIELDKKFSLAHIGTLVKSRNPEILWKVLGELINESPDFKNDLEIKLVGKTDVAVTESLRKYGLTKFVNRISYLNHTEVIKVQQQSQVLLLLLNNTPNVKGILTGKFFEYLSAKRPILCIGVTDGDAAKIIEETNAGIAINFADEVKIRKVVTDYFNLYKNGHLNLESTGIEKYTRRELTKNIAECLNKIIS